ncbi:MAG: RNA polymerase factor sigma-54 [Nitrospiraceae bacterium]|nr:MAG: RNA polymerase factor sigma-54 [Nitrospiraceae bacterium]
MALESRLELKLSQKLVLTPQLQIAIKLLHMPQLELSQTLTNELTENPLLEAADATTTEEIPQEEKEMVESYDDQDQDDSELPLEKMIRFASEDYFEERGSDGRDLGYFTPGNTAKPSFEYFLSNTTDIYDYLSWQLRLSKADEDMRSLCRMIIGNLNENGYLNLSVEELMELTKRDSESVEKAIALIQSFDPPGVGARNITECLRLQLKLLNLQGTLVENIIIHNLDFVGKKKYTEIAKLYNVSLDEVISAVKIIEGLEPKPGRNLSAAATNYVVPDVYIVKTDNGYQIVLNDEGLPRLRISSYYQKLLKQKQTLSKDDKQFLEEKLRSAIWLLKSLDQRNKTIYRVTETILNFQKDFFDMDIHHLKPMNLKDIATELNLHESTVSRVTSNKYVACSDGVFSFKYFFSNSIQGELGGVSSTSIKEMMRRIISEEDSRKPLSDMHIVELLKNRNITIARRTVAKYREELRIPSHSQRKRFIADTPNSR